MTDVKSGEVIDATELGVLQTTRNWASLTAVVGTKASGPLHAATIVVEHSDPFMDGRPRTIRIDFDDGRRIGGVLVTPSRTGSRR